MNEASRAAECMLGAERLRLLLFFCCTLGSLQQAFIHRSMASSRIINVFKNQSRYQIVTIGGKEVHVKRTDEIRVHGLSGTKAYKLFHLIERDLSPQRCIASIGGAQGNFMLSLAKLIKAKNEDTCDAHITPWYFTRRLPMHLKRKPVGNYREALELGLKVEHFI